MLGSLLCLSSLPNLLSRVCSHEQQGAQVARQAVQDVVRSWLILGQSCMPHTKERDVSVKG